MKSSRKQQKKKQDIDINEEEEEEYENEMIEEEEEQNEEEIEQEEDEEDNNKPINKQKSKTTDDDKEEGENAPIDTLNMDIPEMNIRIHKLVEILSDFKNKKSPDRSRSDYISELKNLLIQTYDYNDDICNLILNLFPPNECVEFMESNTTPKALTIRTNTLKTKRRELAKTLISRNINLDPLSEWSKVGLKIYSSSVPIGATPEYLAGHYMLQSASSFLPVLALDPQPNEKILDMCASPGGKTTYIAQLMKNQGILIANDMRKDRIKSLFFNIHRMGIKNSIITNYDGRKLPKMYNSFDRVLLDAPCSGLGVIAKDQSVKVNRTYKEILDNSRVQKELILAAIDSCCTKGSGIIVYSTCSIAVEENEWVVDYALRYRYVKCVEVGFEVGEAGLTSFREKRFHPSVKNCRRIYPHVHNMDGFFVAKLKKYADGVKGGTKEETKEKEEKKNKKKKNKNKIDVYDEEEDIPELVEDEEEEDNDDDENDGIYDDDEDEEEFEKIENVKKGSKKEKDERKKGNNKKKVKEDKKEQKEEKVFKKEKDEDMKKERKDIKKHNKKESKEIPIHINKEDNEIKKKFSKESKEIKKKTEKEDKDIKKQISKESKNTQKQSNIEDKKFKKQSQTQSNETLLNKKRKKSK